MNPALALLDWLVIGGYLVFLVLFALWLARRQRDRADYYVGGRRLGAWPVAISVMATQCSTNSILGAPAFVAFAAGGGLVWLQYELALPLAMIVLILLVMPLFRQLQLVSVYAYLEHRFDLRTRLLLSALFQFARAFATAVTVFSIAIVIDLILGIGFFWSVVILGVFTVVYDVLGGIRGVIYSDVIQMAILVAVLGLLLALLVQDNGGFAHMLDALDPARRRALDFGHHGFGDGETFSFWPMLVGGLFLYLAYYGCDQSQVQRLLCTRDIDTTNRALLINGLLRFPLVALYCLVGAGIAVYAAGSGDFLARLPLHGGQPQYNLAVPRYMIDTLPPGLVGLALVALFAAAMSSLDSVINSLSATTMEDFVVRFCREPLSQRRELLLSRLITVAWGVVTLTLSFFVGDIAPTVLEAINKIGSLANGPILAVFALGLLSRRASGVGACIGLLLGIAGNALLWRYAPGISWLWWNAIGFALTGLAGLLFSGGQARPSVTDTARNILREQSRVNWPLMCGLLATWFVLLFALLASLG
ncbi:sodium:solute symporter [Parahaliea mediterranea]|uniref:Sodium:solute symporter n=1 Tax=Parahaliea mediterranea TaxID=651086 RepID=A0A939ILI2_9GAMM|nr:sodium:solute symporter [Parahaliea mediterranea]MBN7795992.1 sodium:solute symporter [Parahaliea mediterranea]